MASEIEICNSALIQLGAEDTILSLDDDTTPARMCKAMYAICRDEVMTRFAWNSAMEQAQLAALTDAPTWGYTYAFQLPADCLRVVKVSSESGNYDTATGTYYQSSWTAWRPMDWKRHGRKILANSSPLLIAYIKQITDPNTMDPSLRDAISAYLAAKIAYKITGSRAKEEQMKAWFREVIDEAMATNSLEGSSEELTSPQLLAVR